MAKRKYRWYIEPKDAITNEILARNLPEENCQDGNKCADGLKHKLWICTEELRNKLIKSRKNLSLSFRIFRSELPSGAIRDVSFLFTGKKARKNKRKLAESEKS